MYLCSCYSPYPEPNYCGCAGPVPPAACASPHTSTALRLRGGSPPQRSSPTPDVVISPVVSVIVVGPDYQTAGPARIAMPILTTLAQLAEVVFAVYFGASGPADEEQWQLRLMPSNVILAEGFTLLYPCFGPASSDTPMAWAGVVDRSVVQLYFHPQEPIYDPLPPPSPAAGADNIACGEHVEEHVEEHVGKYVGERVGDTSLQPNHPTPHYSTSPHRGFVRR